MIQPLRAFFLVGTLKKKQVLSHTLTLCEVVAGILKSQENVESEIIRLRDYNIQPGTKTEIDDDDWPAIVDKMRASISSSSPLRYGGEFSLRSFSALSSVWTS